MVNNAFGHLVDAIRRNVVGPRRLRLAQIAGKECHHAGTSEIGVKVRRGWRLAEALRF